MKIAALGDIHVSEKDHGKYKDLFVQISKEADVLIICGDLTDRGLASEAQVLREDLKYCTIPVLIVLGNHDYESSEEKEIREVLKSDMVFILDGESIEIQGVGFAGIKGFGGGFDSYILTPWGEKAIKDFVQEAVNDALRLENAIKKLETEKKVVILHYSPIRQTIEGEPLEIYPFLGSSRLAGPINRFDVNLVFHGHAHHGTYEGKTEKGIHVYNVAKHLLEKVLNKSYTIISI